MNKTKQQKLFEQNYKTNREKNCFYSEFNSETLLITKIWDFNRNILSQWADVDLLIGINKNTTNMKMKKGLTTIARNLREIADKLENASKKEYIDIKEMEQKKLRKIRLFLFWKQSENTGVEHIADVGKMFKIRRNYGYKRC